jgi:hypothetical protein
MKGNFMKVKVIRLSNFLIIGKIEQKQVGDYQEMIDPRVVSMTQDGKVGFMPLVGDPKKFMYRKADVMFEYEPEDGLMDKRYQEMVSGIIMPSPVAVPDNLVKMPGA